MDGGTTGGRPHLFTVADYHRMMEAGLFHEDSRIELIKGQLIDMAVISSPHFGMVNRLTRLLFPLVGTRGLVSVQNPVRLDPRSEPQPDVAILKPRADDHETGAPGPDDVLLLIEVADSSLDFDRDEGAALCSKRHRRILDREPARAHRRGPPRTNRRPVCPGPAHWNRRNPGHPHAARRGPARRRPAVWECWLGRIASVGAGAA